jgi:hypothetical protein
VTLRRSSRELRRARERDRERERERERGERERERANDPETTDLKNGATEPTERL